MKFYKLTLASLLLLGGCAGSGLLAGEPMGKQLERALEEIKKDCIARGAPPFGPGSTQYSDTSCLMFTLKPWEPGDTPESAFAHSIKLPPPHDKPKDVYRPGMSSEEYFNALCKEEAGEWVFRKVEGVRGIRQERPPQAFPQGFRSIVYGSVEMAGLGSSKPEEAFTRPFGGYEFFELRQSITKGETKKATYRRFATGTNVYARLPEEITQEPIANVAVTWRGIRRPQDLEHAIQGSELIIFQVNPIEVLAYRRSFARYYFDLSTREFRTPWSAACPRTDGRNVGKLLIENVLIPSK